MSIVLEDRPAPRRLRRAVAAGAAALTAVAVLAPAAGAAPTPLVSSELHWGFKSGFRTYIINIASGSVSPSDGASFEGAGNAQTRPYLWSGAGGTLDPATGDVDAKFDGKVVYRSTAHTIWNITIEDPEVVLAPNGSGQLLADVTYSTGGTEAAPESQGAAQDVAIATLQAPAPTVNGDTRSYSGVTATLTAAGAEAFNQQYTEGTALDPLAFTVSLGDAIAPAAPTVTMPKIDKTNQTAVPISGTGEAGTTATISVDDSANATPAVVKVVPVGPSGFATTMDLSSLNDLSVRATVTLTDAAGNVSAPGTVTVNKNSGNYTTLIKSIYGYLLAFVGF